VQILTISMDLPFAQARWCGAVSIGHPALSAHTSEDFGRAYGVLLKEWRLLQRAVLVLDRSGAVTYAEYVADQMAEPNYAAALAAAGRLVERAGKTTPSVRLCGRSAHDATASTAKKPV